MKKKIIGVDLDEVLMDALTPTCHFLNKHYNAEITRADVFAHDFAAVWEQGLEEIATRMEEFYASPHHDEGVPISGAVVAIDALKDTHELHIITARPSSAKEVSVRWLEKHFPNTFKSVHFTKHYYNETSKSKGDICRELDISIFIDDAPHNVDDVAPVVEKVFLMHSPWNKEYTPAHTNVARVHSWKEIREFLER
ncbi:MAG: hypothetical protein WD003_01740 [Candidatus Paceibacterota bacterium]